MKVEKQQLAGKLRRLASGTRRSDFNYKKRTPWAEQFLFNWTTLTAPFLSLNFKIRIAGPLDLIRKVNEILGK
jgi:hypothetical protein